MEKIILYSSPYLLIEWCPILSAFYLTWRDQVNGEIVKSEGLEALRLMRLFRATAVLNINIDVKGNWVDVAAWVVNTWFSDMFNAGMRYFAWVMPTDELAITSARKAMPPSRCVRAFDDVNEASAWLIDSLESDANFRKQLFFDLDVARLLTKEQRERLIHIILKLIAFRELQDIVKKAITEIGIPCLLDRIRQAELALEALGVPGLKPTDEIRRQVFRDAFKAIDDSNFLDGLYQD